MLMELLGITPSEDRNRGSVMLGGAVVLAAVALTGFALTAQVGTGDNSYHLSAHFDTVNGIIVGSEVDVAGVVVGNVSGETVDADSKGVVVDMSIDPRYAPVHDGATAAVRPKSLLGEKYIALSVGDPAKQTLPSGTMLPRSATSVNVEIDQLINTFDAPTREQLRNLINELGTGLAGQGKTTNQTLQSGRADLDSLAQVTDVLKQRDSELKTVIQALTKLTETLSSDQQRANYPDLLKHGDEVLTTLKSEDADVQSGIDRMDAFFAEIDAGLSGQGPNLADILGKLPMTLTDLDTLSRDMYTKGLTAYPLLTGTVIPSVIGGPVVFGSQTAGDTFTRNVYTRVQTPIGCASYDGTNPDGTDSGKQVGSVCSIPASNCVAQNLTPAACQATLQAEICALALQTPLGASIPECKAAAPVAPAPKTGASSPATPAIDPNLQQQIQDQILRYLLR